MMITLHTAPRSFGVGEFIVSSLNLQSTEYDEKKFEKTKKKKNKLPFCQNHTYRKMINDEGVNVDLYIPRKW